MEYGKGSILYCQGGHWILTAYQQFFRNQKEYSLELSESFVILAILLVQILSKHFNVPETGKQQLE